jgi:hypothetical protein
LLNEADTCRKYVVPRLTQSGWDDEPHSFTEQRSFIDGVELDVLLPTVLGWAFRGEL